ncbi:MAG TPA: 3-phosphoshikimate 1-carboxyvinyltransferase [Burkholderiaceae bacterium]
MDHLDLAPIARMAGAVQLPGSKSISNRTLLLSALARGSTEVVGLLDADDVEIMLAALRALGVGIEQRAGGRDFAVDGAGGSFAVKRARLFLGNAGTAFRPLTAVLALCGGNYELDGVARMRERPIGDLVDALRALGGDIRYLGAEGFPPLVIGPGQLNLGARVAIRGEISSQFVTALLLALPLAGRAIAVDIVGELVSGPYVEMTLHLMARFGVVVLRDGPRRLLLPATDGYRSPGRIVVEGDASSASYFLAAGAIGGGPVRVHGVGSDSIQGDVGFAETLAAMGADITRGSDWIEARGEAPLKAFDADFTSMPDAAMTAAVAALFARGTSTLRDIGSWRVKETDRIHAMASELVKLGAAVDAGADWLSITPPAQLSPATIDTYDDHRIAMCFSLAALGGVAVRINDPQCVRKTFPDYFAIFASLAR